jgi:hypothetical protein
MLRFFDTLNKCIGKNNIDEKFLSIFDRGRIASINAGEKTESEK